MSPFRVATVRIISRKSAKRTLKSLPRFEGGGMSYFQPRLPSGVILLLLGLQHTHGLRAAQRPRNAKRAVGRKVTAPPWCG